ncbi:hypothetical protein [Streptomyces sp. NPDC047841]|uniref:hypothetical protein n=1 Tax=Streptomyces sp. NPDC047841 TaxID=3154708 RepID=UPI0034547CCE
MPAGGPWEWARRIGTTVCLFRVDKPGVNGYPFGSVTVRRIAKDGAPVPHIEQDGTARPHRAGRHGPPRAALPAARHR